MPRKSLGILQDRNNNLPQPNGAGNTPVKSGGKIAVIQAANRLREGHPTPNRSFSAQQHVPQLVVESQRYEEWMKIATDNVSRSPAYTHASQPD